MRRVGKRRSPRRPKTGQLPTDVVVRPKLVVTRKSGEAILEKMRAGKPTKALRDLMREAD